MICMLLYLQDNSTQITLPDIQTWATHTPTLFMICMLLYLQDNSAQITLPDIQTWATHTPTLFMICMLLYLQDNSAQITLPDIQTWATHTPTLSRAMFRRDSQLVSYFLYNLTPWKDTLTVADPGFLVGGSPTVGGRGPPMRVLFGENVCEHERIGSHWVRECLRHLRSPQMVWRNPGLYKRGSSKSCLR